MRRSPQLSSSGSGKSVMRMLQTAGDCSKRSETRRIKHNWILLVLAFPSCCVYCICMSTRLTKIYALP